MKRFTWPSRVLAPLLVLAWSNAQAQLSDFGADIQTSPTDTTRLFLDTAESQLAPVGTALWIVADTAGGGFPTQNVTTTRIDNIVNGTDDIRRFFSDTVDGLAIGQNPGKYSRNNVTVSGAYATASIGVMLWNDANHDSTIGDAGDTFGFYSIGEVLPPQVGNAAYLIAGNIHADEHLIVAVPEPAQTALAAGALCVAALFLRRLRWA